MTEPATNILISGADGQLGRELQKLRWPDGCKVRACPKGELDITDLGAVERMVGEGNYHWIVNAAAFTDVDRAESDRELAFAVNEDGPRNLAQACENNGAILIHVSTDYVFDGTNQDLYLEDDPMAPTGVYGASKAAGEGAVRGLLAQHIIVRTAWLVSAHGKNFVTTILRQASERDELRIISDQIGSPTTAGDLAQALGQIVAQLGTDAGDPAPGPWGTYHCANAGAASWFDLAREIVATAMPESEQAPTVIPISTGDYPTAARRPKNSHMCCEKIYRAFGIRMPAWDTAVRKLVHELVGGEQYSVTGR